MNKKIKLGRGKQIYVINFFFAVLLCIIMAPMIYTIGYSIPHNDDYAMFIPLQNGTLTNIFIQAAILANKFWNNWSGDWSYTFLEYLLNPITNFGISSIAFGIEMIIFFLLFVTSQGLLFQAVFSRILKVSDSRIRWFCFLIFISFFLNTRIYPQVFYWYVGASYMWGVTLCSLTMWLEVIYFTNGYKKITAYILSVVGLVSCMNLLVPVVPGVFYIILIWINVKIKKQTFKGKYLLPLGAMVLGGVLALIAPGNYMRKSGTTYSDYNFGKAIVDSCIDFAKLCKSLLINPFTIIYMIIFIVIGIKILKKVKYSFKYPIIPYILYGITMIITCFPVAFGYGVAMVPNRIHFVLHAYSYLLLLLCALYTGAWVYRKWGDEIKGCHLKYLCVISLMFLYCAVIPTKYYNDLPFYVTIVQAKQITQCSNEWRKIYKEVEQSKEESIVIYADKILCNVPMLLDPDKIEKEEEYLAAVGDSIARVCGKKSVEIIISN